METLLLDDNILIHQAQSGDKTALSTLMVKYDRLIFKVVFSHYQHLAFLYNRASGSLLEVEDLHSIAKVAFIEAVQTWLFQKEFTFASYAALKMKFELFVQVKELQGPVRLPAHIFGRKKQRSRNQSLKENVTYATSVAIDTTYSSVEVPLHLTSKYGIDEYELYKEDLLNLIERAFSRQIREIFRLRIEGLSCIEISRVTDVSQKQASFLFHKVLGSAKNLEQLEKRLEEIINAKRIHQRPRIFDC